MSNETNEEKKADEFFEAMHKATRSGLHREIEKMYNEIKDLKLEREEMLGDLIISMANLRSTVQSELLLINTICNYLDKKNGCSQNKALTNSPLGEDKGQVRNKRNI